MPSETELRAATKNGRFCGMRALGTARCPYPIEGTAKERVLAKTWLKAYREWIPTMIDYGH